MPRVITKETLIKGQPRRIDCMEVLGQTYVMTHGPVTIVALEDEWYEDVRDPAETAAALCERDGITADVFTFWQRLPDIKPRYSYHQEWDQIAVLSFRSYEQWWNEQIRASTRNRIRKAERDGVVIRETSFDDEFVRGMTAIFNEAPIRQGRPFWHYGKDAETVKHQFSRFIHREHMIGAYYRDEMVGLIMLGNAGRFAITGQIIASLKHRDKPVANALVAKAVQRTEQLGLQSLAYYFWSDDSLGGFKRRCGFERVSVPRYFVPITRKGRIAIALGLHRGWRGTMPAGIRTRLKRVRTVWYDWHSRRRAAEAK